MRCLEHRASSLCLIAVPGVGILIPAQSPTFVEIYHEKISAVILLPSAVSFKKVSYQLQAKVSTRSIGEFRPQTDQRSDDSNLQHVKRGKQVETVINRYHRRYIIHYHDYIGNFQQLTQLSLWLGRYRSILTSDGSKIRLFEFTARERGNR